MNDAYDREHHCTTASVKLGSTGGEGHTAGFRFTDVSRPAGRTVASAYLLWISNATDASDVRVRIYGEKAAATQEFDCADNRPSQRRRTTTYVDYRPGPWTAEQTYSSPDLAPILNEILAGAGEAWDRSFVLLVSDNGSVGLREPKAYDYEAAKAARLVITWASAAPTSTPTPTPTLTPSPTRARAAAGAWLPLLLNRRAY
jgi:hypothetical protein